MQEIVSIRDANQHPSRYLERVEQGAEVIITRRGRPIACLLPIEPESCLSEAQPAARERLKERREVSPSASYFRESFGIAWSDSKST